MSSASQAASIGIDFGTSNTVVAIASGNGDVDAIRFEHDGTARSVYTSALCFWQERSDSVLPPHVEGGPWAIDRLLEGHAALRFMQSFKTFAASRSFEATTVFRQRFQFEDLLLAFLLTLPRHGSTGFDLAASRVIVGRPVHFAGSNPDDALAMQRYRDAFGRFGAGEAAYVYEPVGAAFSFARDIDRDATVLVADFGGGTSDFSVMRFSRAAGVLRAEPLGHAGIGVAGDTFDARIVEHIVSPRLGEHGSYRSFGKVLPMPKHYYAKLARWHELAMLKGSADLRDLRALTHTALDPEPLRDFIALIELDLGFPLYRVVSAAKVALSSHDAVEFHFAEGDIDISASIARADFEHWIADDLARIAATVDQVLNAAKITPREIDRVFLTGGTSFVPAVQHLFAGRFGSEKLTSADQFESIAYGLALIGQTENPKDWAVAA